MNKDEDEDDQFFVKLDTHPSVSKNQKSKKSAPAKPKTLKDAITKVC